MILEGKRTDGIIVKEFSCCVNIPCEKRADNDSKKGFDIIEFDLTIHDENCEENCSVNTGKYNAASAAQIMLDKDRSFRVKNDRHFFSDALVYFETEIVYHVKILIDSGMEEYDVWITKSGEEPVRMAERYQFGTEFSGNHILSACVVSNAFCFSIDNVSVNKVENKPYWGPDKNHKPITYHVGPEREFKTLQEVTNRLKPGDMVLVDGDCEYPGQVSITQSGTSDARITIKGVKINGKRPIIDGKGEWQDGVELSGHFCDFEGFEVRNAKRCGIHHHANSVVIRDTIVHDCPDGILSFDVNTGSITIEYCEVYRCGFEMYEHQLYIATDERRFPGSVFRLQHCYIHDGLGGHNVKSRSERDEIYYNWIEGAYYHNLELIGPDPDYNAVSDDLAREDSDVVGNVLISYRWYMVRAGGDGTGQSKGRYRFVNNTFIFREKAGMEAFRLMWGIESLELQNNVFYGTNGIKLGILHEDKVEWTSGKRQIWGSNNWVQDTVNVPEGLTGTIYGENPGFTDVNSFDLKPVKDSPLAAGERVPALSREEYQFPNPLEVPEFMPPERVMKTSGEPGTRRKQGSQMAIGAFDVKE